MKLIAKDSSSHQNINVSFNTEVSMHSDRSERREFSKIQIFNVAPEKEPSTHSLHLSILGEGEDRKRTQAFKVMKMLVLLQYLSTTLILKPHVYLCFGGPVISGKEMVP